MMWLGFGHDSNGEIKSLLTKIHFLRLLGGTCVGAADKRLK